MPGTESVFRGYAITCLLVLLAYFSLNYFYIAKLPVSESAEEPKQFMEEGLHLAPCGVPMGINRNLSSSKLQEMDHGKSDGYSNILYTVSCKYRGHSSFVDLGDFEKYNSINYPCVHVHVRERCDMDFTFLCSCV